MTVPDQGPAALVARLRVRLARRLRFAADRLDHAGAPKRMSTLTLALERGKGWVLRKDGVGVPVWYYGDQDYLRAWPDAQPKDQIPSGESP